MLNQINSSSKHAIEEESSFNSPDPARRVKFAESLVTYAADNSSSSNDHSNSNDGCEGGGRASHIQLYNDESIFKNLEIFKEVTVPGYVDVHEAK